MERFTEIAFMNAIEDFFIYPDEKKDDENYIDYIYSILTGPGEGFNHKNGIQTMINDGFELIHPEAHDIVLQQLENQYIKNINMMKIAVMLSEHDDFLKHADF